MEFVDDTVVDCEQTDLCSGDCEVFSGYELTRSCQDDSVVYSICYNCDE